MGQNFHKIEAVRPPPQAVSLTAFFPFFFMIPLTIVDGFPVYGVQIDGLQFLMVSMLMDLTECCVVLAHLPSFRACSSKIERKLNFNYITELASWS